MEIDVFLVGNRAVAAGIVMVSEGILFGVGIRAGLGLLGLRG